NILMGPNNNMTLNLGIRGTYTFLNEELLISPRIQYSLKPNWDHDIVFRLATGLYAQPAFYREMRSPEGILNTDLKAQKSYHIATGFDYNLKMLDDRPFKLSFEDFYKSLWDSVPYEYDNLRIHYLDNIHTRHYD